MGSPSNLPTEPLDWFCKPFPGGTDNWLSSLQRRPCFMHNITWSISLSIWPCRRVEPRTPSHQLSLKWTPMECLHLCSPKETQNSLNSYQPHRMCRSTTLIRSSMQSLIISVGWWLCPTDVGDRPVLLLRPQGWERYTHLTALVISSLSCLPSSKLSESPFPAEPLPLKPGISS
jgi:hypothetical protein